MEDLADEGCGVPIFIRCPGHLWGDAKFGQIGERGDLAGVERSAARAGGAGAASGP
ncbi:hypothetical protein ACFYWX_31125 [Streptomyces sp. NPDC002888]|uniref:hypothetical protein n=1 Tax=Streptomyces sp. NPDC002888 TaxID=3364668 RepID=UPI0036A023B3